MLSLHQTLTYYKRRDIQEELVGQAKNKEVAFRFNDVFGKRPETLTYPADVLELAKQRMTSLHCSEENWSNPLQISTGMKKEELDRLRTGWDLVLDIDCHLFEYSRIAAHLTVQALKVNGVKSITAKFSGNKGFHIAVPFEAFPRIVGGRDCSNLFPDAPRRIAAYISDMIRERLGKDIMLFEQGSFTKVMEKTGLKESEIVMYQKNEFGDSVPALNVKSFLEIDTILIAPRHLFRMPYSMHEKSGLVSVPLDVDKISEFKKEDAKPENVKVGFAFLDRSTKEADAELLLRNAMDYEPAVEPIAKEFLEQEKKRQDFEMPEKAIGEEHFPPCIQYILKGVEDGRKRGVFVLIKFLYGCGWDFDAIEKKLLEWNQKNSEPLKDQYMLGPLRYAKQQVKTRKLPPPPNCANQNYYLGGAACKAEVNHARIKNPLQYAKMKALAFERSANRVRKIKN